MIYSRVVEPLSKVPQGERTLIKLLTHALTPARAIDNWYQNRGQQKTPANRLGLVGLSGVPLHHEGHLRGVPPLLIGAGVTT